MELPEDLEAALKAKALEQGVSLARFTRQVLEQAVRSVEEQRLKPKKSACGLLTQYGPGPSEEDIDENRREMFRGFAQDIT